jgi:hypothetical protein
LEEVSRTKTEREYQEAGSSPPTLTVVASGLTRPTDEPCLGLAGGVVPAASRTTTDEMSAAVGFAHAAETPVPVTDVVVNKVTGPGGVESAATAERALLGGPQPQRFNAVTLVWYCRPLTSPVSVRERDDDGSAVEDHAVHDDPDQALIWTRYEVIADPFPDAASQRTRITLSPGAAVTFGTTVGRPMRTRTTLHGPQPPAFLTRTRAS